MATEKTIALKPSQVEKINARANAVFESHKDVTTVLACIDGQIFLEKDKNAALAHARKCKQLELIVIEKGTALEANEADEEGGKGGNDAAKEAAKAAKAEAAAVAKAEADAAKAAAEEAKAAEKAAKAEAAAVAKAEANAAKAAAEEAKKGPGKK